MQLENGTPFAARILRLDRGQDQIQSVVVVKSTFERDAAGKFVPAQEQVPIVDDRLDTAFGVFHTDCFVRKEHTDICVLGTVRLDYPVKTTKLTLTLDGTQRAALSLFGDRRWIRMGTKLVPSEPLAFQEMALGYARAYGGVTEHDHEPVVWPDNPVGRGHYLAEGKAVDQPLPNIEPGDGPLVRDWRDQPQVAGWAPYPLFWGIRAREGIEINDDRVFPGRLRARLNNNAHPALIFPDVGPRSVLRIQGMRSKDLVFELPHVSPIVHVELGDQTMQVESRLDGVFVWVDAGRITLTHRAHFNYVLQKGERRSARLADAAARKGA